MHRDIGTRIILGEIVDALRASEPRHTDFTDFNGCHGLIRTLILELAAGFWHLATGSRHSLLC